jgi:hypothetical protein
MTRGFGLTLPLTKYFQENCKIPEVVIPDLSFVIPAQAGIQGNTGIEDLCGD